MDEKYPLSALTGRIIAAAMEVHRTLGRWFMEVIYQRALAKELPRHGVEFSREVWIDVMYKGEKVGRKRVDFVAGMEAAMFWWRLRRKGTYRMWILCRRSPI